MKCDFCENGVAPFYPATKKVNKNSKPVTVCHTCRHSKKLAVVFEEVESGEDDQADPEKTQPLGTE